jgi:uncharacterized membrane protein
MNQKVIKHIKAKHISWYITEAAITFAVTLLITKDAHISLTITFAEAITRIVFKFLHDKIWDKINIGESKPTTEFEI